MICFIAMIVFGILGVFSAKYRIIAKEAADCVFRRLTLRKCESGLDKRLKNQISGKLAKKKPRLAKFLYKYFEVFSWALIILLVWSLISLGIGVYNYAAYGNCNGPQNSNDFCIFDPSGSNSQYSGIAPKFEGEKVIPSAGRDPSIGPQDAKVTIIEFGCFSCPYTKKAESTIKQLIKEYENESVKFVFKAYPIPSHQGSGASALAGECAYQSGNYFEAREYLFDNNYALNEYSTYETLANNLGINSTDFFECMNSNQTKSLVLQSIDEGNKAHVYGTPTYFINNETIVGPKDKATFENIINKELAK